MQLVELLDPEFVVAGLRVGSVTRLLERLATLLAQRGDTEIETVQNALAARERLSPTALGHGVALPHAAVPGLPRPRVAFARLARPLAMGAPDGEPVDLVCALVVPDSFTDAKLRLLADIAEKFGSAGSRQRLREAADAQALYGVLAGPSGRPA